MIVLTTLDRVASTRVMASSPPLRLCPYLSTSASADRGFTLGALLWNLSHLNKSQRSKNLLFLTCRRAYDKHYLYHRHQSPEIIIALVTNNREDFILRTMLWLSSLSHNILWIIKIQFANNCGLRGWSFVSDARSKLTHFSTIFALSIVLVIVIVIVIVPMRHYVCQRKKYLFCCPTACSLPRRKKPVPSEALSFQFIYSQHEVTLTHLCNLDLSIFFLLTWYRQHLVSRSTGCRFDPGASF